MTMEDEEPVRPACRCGDAACPQGPASTCGDDIQTSSGGRVLERLDLIVSELAGLPHVVQTCREAAAEIRSLRESEGRWIARFAVVREASGIGVVPMLSEVPAALAALRDRAKQQKEI